jgi:hypothetical protein
MFKFKLADRYAKLDDWDHVFQKFLLTMSIETNADLKQSYAKHIQLFVSGLRVGVVRWLSKGDPLNYILLPSSNSFVCSTFGFSVCHIGNVSSLSRHGGSRGDSSFNTPLSEDCDAFC